MRSLMIFGAGRGVGLEVARLATRAVVQRQPDGVLTASPDMRISAFVRQRAPELEELKVAQQCGDLEDRHAVEAAYSAAGEVGAVVCTISNGPFGSLQPFAGVENVVAGALRSGASHLVLVSSLGAGESRAYASKALLEALGKVLKEKTEAEDCVKNSGLCYTILRPGRLVNDPITHRGAMVEDPSVHGDISRRDLASLILEALERPDCRNQVFSAVDRSFLAEA